LIDKDISDGSNWLITFYIYTDTKFIENGEYGDIQIGYWAILPNSYPNKNLSAPKLHHTYNNIYTLPLNNSEPITTCLRVTTHFGVFLSVMSIISTQSTASIYFIDFSYKKFRNIIQLHRKHFLNIYFHILSIYARELPCLPPTCDPPGNRTQNLLF
jgi:hypothetical protein